MTDVGYDRRTMSRIHVWGFVKAVAAGSLAGAAPMMLMTVPIGLFMALQGTWSEVLVGLRIMFLPLMVSTPVVLVSSVLIGIPTFLLLRRKGLETPTAYAVAGAVMGIVVTICFDLVAGGEASGLLLNLGALAGGVTGWSWWRWGRRPAISASKPSDPDVIEGTS